MVLLGVALAVSISFKLAGSPTNAALAAGTQALMRNALAVESDGP